MLQLQRASAGSGKTFTLAKKFIWFLLTVQEGQSPVRLRNAREIADGLPRILAITFTNKATNEMKMRIVEKLSDLARAAGPSPLTECERKSINYLDEFAGQLGVAAEEIGKAASIALSALLNGYSDFKVSTIDSFFQTVLRTFAYESNLNDSYQVEIDNDFIAAAAVDDTLYDIDAGDTDGDVRFWLALLMAKEAESGSKNWNVFQKSDSDFSIYTRLLKSVKRLDSEDFKNIRDSLDEYFGAPGGNASPLRRAWERAVVEIEKPVEEALRKAKSGASRLKALFIANGLNPVECGFRYLDSHISKISALSANEPKSSKLLFSPVDMSAKKSVFKTTAKKEPVVSTPDDAEMLETAREMYGAYAEFTELRDAGLWKLWNIYSPHIPYLGLIGAAMKKMRHYLDANNTIQLAETNSMLRRIIGDDDAPFIYERLGSRLNHFLIDEFQDTSRLQWENLRPLLHESDSRGEQNLIIGDAKQSIYRFRNADPSLITHTVPLEFPGRTDAGFSREDNTNWRSDRTIVEFNNLFFHCLGRHLASLSKGFIDFPDLYANVVQYPKHRERRGYVEINFLEAPAEIPDSRGRMMPLPASRKRDALVRAALSRIGPLLSSLLDRGYRQGEIALLVKTNTLAKLIIDTLVAYNASLPDNAVKIEFLSEESLLVSSSEAVGIIVSVLSKMADGTSSLPDTEGATPPRWDTIRCNFSFYALRHPELTPAQQVKGFLEEESPVDSIDAMLASMQTVALPALVEAITENFIPEDMRRSQAVFIAGFQDLVIEYCDMRPTDISSFLEWWKAKGVSRSISSPEGTDAVQIMTIHKSKGLEFKCVILPFEDSPMVSSSRSELKWAETGGAFAEMGFPPYLPVETSQSLAETIHADIYNRYFDLYAMDQLNACYVAFTRAVSELYVFTGLPSGKKGNESLGKILHGFFTPSQGAFNAGLLTEDTEDLLPLEMIEWDAQALRVRIGSKPLLPAVSAADSGKSPRIITGYRSDGSQSVLKYVETAATDNVPEALQDDEDSDPRSEGNVLHGIMSLVKTPDDLPTAILQFRMRGLISSTKAKETGQWLRECMEQPAVRSWFSDRWRVVNERDIIIPGHPNKRPDRVMIAPDKSCAVVIDYKFGETPAPAHKAQVEEYAAAVAETTGIRNVSAWLWYVRLGETVRVK